MKKITSILATVYLLVLLATPTFAYDAHGGRVTPPPAPGVGTVGESGKTMMLTLDTVLKVLKINGIAIGL